MDGRKGTSDEKVKVCESVDLTRRDLRHDDVVGGAMYEIEFHNQCEVVSWTVLPRSRIFCIGS